MSIRTPSNWSRKLWTCFKQRVDLAIGVKLKGLDSGGQWIFYMSMKTMELFEQTIENRNVITMARQVEVKANQIQHSLCNKRDGCLSHADQVSSF